MTERFILDSRLQPSLDEFKAHLRITANDQDALLSGYLKAAVAHAEHFIGRDIVQSQRIQKEAFSRTLALSWPISIECVKVDGSVLDASSYTLKDGKLVITDESVQGAELAVSYIAGMKYVPHDIRVAVLLHASALFNNPVDSVETLPKASTNLLRPHRSWGLGK